MRYKLKNEGLRDIVKKLDFKKVDDFIHEIYNALMSENNIYICGNGGSSSTANLLEVNIKKLLFENKTFKGKVYSLASNVSLLHTITDEYNYNEVFSKQLEIVGKEDDLLICISGSGNSENIIKVIMTAKESKLRVVSLLGMGGGACLDYSDFCILIDSYDIQYIEDLHSMIVNASTELLRSVKF